MEDVFFVTIDDGVSGVVPPLAADDDVDPAGQDIDDLSFAFIPPLGAY
jgi:hypothetical protein